MGKGARGNMGVAAGTGVDSPGSGGGGRTGSGGRGVASPAGAV